jgi:predicted permease
MQILSITAPIFILIGLGFFAARAGVMSREQIRSLGVFVITFALPALVIRAMGTRPLEEVLDARFVIAYGLGSLLVYFGGLTYALRFRKLPLTKGAILALGMCCSNSGFIGYPIAATALGPVAAVAMALCMLVENLIMIPLALMLAESGSNGNSGRLRILIETGRRLLKSPVILSMLVALTLSLLQVQLPAVLLKPIDLLASASAPVALFVIGGLLYGLRPSGVIADVGQVVIGKLILHPLCVAITVALLGGIDPMLSVAAVVFASVPVMSIFPIVGQRFGLEEPCAAALFVATLMAFFTITIVLSYFATHMPVG